MGKNLGYASELWRFARASVVRKEGESVHFQSLKIVVLGLILNHSSWADLELKAQGHPRECLFYFNEINCLLAEKCDFATLMSNHTVEYSLTRL